MTTLDEILAYPIKALDPVRRSETRISDAGGLRYDRTYAIVDADGKYINGKRTSKVHQLRAAFDASVETVELSSAGLEPHAFHLTDERGELESWLSEFFDTEVFLEEKNGGELTDGAVYGDDKETGPTLISRSTIEEVASWFPDITPAEMKLRLRPNLVIDGVPAFWEDRLVADGGQQFEIGGATLEGTEPIPRCVVPSRDPYTGDEYDGFRKTLLENREATLPDWAPMDHFEHYFKLMIGTRALETGRTTRLATGDRLTRD